MDNWDREFEICCYLQSLTTMDLRRFLGFVTDARYYFSGNSVTVLDNGLYEALYQMWYGAPEYHSGNYYHALHCLSLYTEDFITPEWKAEVYRSPIKFSPRTWLARLRDLIQISLNTRVD